MPVLGIDVGNCGAIALIDDDGQLVEVHDTPTLNNGPKGRPTINAPLLAELIAKTHIDIIYVEYVGPRPGEGAVGAFAFGRAKGIIEGIAAGLNIPVKFITAPTWKRVIGIPPGKDGVKNMARGEAIRRWPGRAELFKLQKHDGRAEACLIAVAGRTL
jgi:hypothetical protein